MTCTSYRVRMEASDCDDRAGKKHPTVLVAHAGKQHAYRHAAAVEQAGCLHKFVTSGYYKPDRWPDRLLSRVHKLDVALRRRLLNDLSSDRVIRRWRLELPELFARDRWQWQTRRWPRRAPRCKIRSVGGQTVCHDSRHLLGLSRKLLGKLTARRDVVAVWRLLSLPQHT